MENDIIALVKELAEKLGANEIDVAVETSPEVITIAIKSADERTLLGRDGERFDALNHLLKRILAKKVGEERKISIDINSRKQKAEEVLKTKALIIAERAREFKTAIEMEPMSSYERMIIHTVLEGAPNIKTESKGEGRERRIVVHYTETTAF